MRKISQITLICLLTLLVSGNFVYAATVGGYARARQQLMTVSQTNGLLAADQTEALTLDQDLVDNGGTKNFFSGELQLIFLPQSLTKPTGVQVSKTVTAFNLPWNLNQISAVYQINLDDDTALNPDIGWQAIVSQNQPTENYRQLFYYDRQNSAWRVLASKLISETEVSVQLKTAFWQIAAFSYQDIPAVGQASWYAYKGGNFAASPDFAKGSKLLVTNLDNGKQVTVEINDWGPDRTVYPDRIIDLDKVAFQKIASLGAGVIKVKIEPISVAADSLGRVLGVKLSGMAAEPRVSAKSAVIMTADSTVVYNKNGAAALPIASLSKLVSVWVYLQNRPAFFKPIAYQEADAKYNYLYVKPWESAKTDLKNGETVLPKDLIYAALVGSHNNAVETLARASGLSRSEFIKQMNQAVKNWGAADTRFIEPTGLSTDNISTAQDFAKIVKATIQNELIGKISLTAKYEFTTLNSKRKITIKNVDRLVGALPALVGGKTGYLNEARHCLAVKIAGSDKEFYLVTLGSPNRDTSFAEMAELANYALKKL